MALVPGTRIGSYEIIAPLGAGGMGEVYRARDSHLKREVALKTLPEGLGANDERLARFQREAEVLAALNHPNIAQIHGLAEGQSGGSTVRALVMELVEGDDLAARIASGGALPVAEALAIARQIALALDFAHERGIIHRDLKPANVKVTPDGVVKVLDFGLAKAVSADASGDGNAPNSPTITSPAMTQRGVILGTAAYMSPEQAKGKQVDKRSDIWSFGCVLYEMLTGRRTFDGEDVTDSIVAVMSRDPKWSTLPPSLPPAISRLLRRCLEKERAKRLADIRDALLELDDAATPVEPAAKPSSVIDRARWTAVGAMISAAVAGIIIATGLPRGGATAPRPLDLSFFHTEGRDVATPHISPDGRKVAYRARRGDGMPMIWVRDLESGDTRTVAGTEDGTFPFWSPDSRHIGFLVSRMVKRVPVEGGPAQLLAANGPPNPVGADWAAGKIIYAGLDNSPLRVVAETGGEARPATQVQGPDWTHAFPSFLPDGRKFIFTAKLWSQSAESSQQGIYAGSLDSMEVRRLLPDLSRAVFAAPGYLIFARAGKLTAVAFDAQTSTLRGEPFSLGGPELAVDPIYYGVGISAATDGTLAIRPAPANIMHRSSGEIQLELVDRAERRRAVGQPVIIDGPMALSRDRTGLVVGVAAPDGTIELGLLNLRSGVRSPITTARAYTGWPVWSPGDRLLAYAYQTVGMADDIYVRDMVTGRTSPLIESTDWFEHPIAWSHDGAFLLADVWQGDTRSLAVFSVATKAKSVFSAASTSYSAAFSPDDKYVVFNSTETGRYEAYVTTFPDRRQTWPLTSNGGRAISWSADGKEILVSTMTGEIAAYRVTAMAGGFTTEPPSIVARDVPSVEWSVAAADHSFIVTRTDIGAAKDRGEIRLLFGWTSRLSKSR